jgi:S-adenosylmethionine:tRNA ribosyltransferase-isomerase
MKVADFDYTLPAARIAQFPAATREDARLLVLGRDSGTTSHGSIRDLARHLVRGDLLVVNDTRVFPARLLGRRVPSGGTVAGLLLARLDEKRWEALMHPGQKLRPGGRVVFERNGRVLEGEVLERRFFGRRVIRLWAAGGRDVDDVIDAIGHVPLPPYIHRPDEALDRERYQTVYATRRGSVAAPTAGLHLTAALLRQLETNGVETVAVTLHVGYGTFKPVRADLVEEHHVDAERFVVSEEAAGAINLARRQGRRIVAVGTTTTRTLESAVDQDGRIRPGSGETDLFIRPGHQFRVVSGLLTNFHLPRSSLLMLVCALAGREPVLAAYREAVERGYRFYSYGDAMLIL